MASAIARRALVVIAGCRPPAGPPVLANQALGAAPADARPCGVDRLLGLDLSTAPGIGRCTIEPSSALDRDGGRSRRTVYDGRAAVVSLDRDAYPRMVVFDPRIATEHGLRVGMTGADVARALPRAAWTCARDVPAWGERTSCTLRLDSDPDCDVADAGVTLLVFDAEPALARGAELAGAPAQALVRARPVRAIDLGPACGGW